MQGLVIKNSGSWYLVKTDAGDLVECKIKGSFRIRDIRTTNPIAIGDRVHFEQIDNVSGLIYEICERRNYVIRRSSNLSKHAHILAANLDLAVLIVTIKHPVTYTIFIDRFLATAEAYRIPACLVFNKIDCYDDDDFEYLRAVSHLYTTLGYPIFEVSALQPETLSALIDFLKGKINLFSGNSGVGKSTLIKAILPDIDIKIGDISAAHHRGTHTTTLSEMYALENGGYIIDTPGIKGFGLVDMEKDEIGHYFKEIFMFSKKCKFSNCRHIHEPDCAVRKAVENHEISQSRYQSYLNILNDCDSEKYRV